MRTGMTAFLERLGITLPIVQAPMAGGPDTPELAAAVSRAGGLGSLGCAYLSTSAMEDVVARARAQTSNPIGVNLFVREDSKADVGAEERASNVLAPFRRELGLPASPPPPKPVPSFSEQFACVLRLRPRVFSFTFGMPSPAQIRALRDANIVSVGTATSLDEARALEALGVDAICAQGSEAGGHRGTFLGRFEDSLIGTLALTRQIVSNARVPVVAAGGIMDGAGIVAALALGAAAVQLGTAFLLCPEAGTAPAYRAALTSPEGRTTVITRAFSGRPARGVRNRMTDAFEREEAAPFPQQQHLTADLRAAATNESRADLMQLWSGQGAPLLRTMPAAALVRTLATEANLMPRREAP